MEGICGRMCDACTWKEQLDCPGCQDGPGRRFSGGCPIADCCREKGHTACVTCTFSTGCALRRRDMPQNRLWAVEAERERRARLDRNAPVLAKWLWLLFWLVTPSVFSNILTMDTVAGAFPTAGVVGNVLAFLISLAYGVLLWQLREAAGRYRTAALCYLAGGIISGVLLLPAIPEGNWLWWLLSLPVMVLELCAAYQEFYAHAEVLEELDPELAGKWRLLWKWWIGLLLGMHLPGIDFGNSGSSGDTGGRHRPVGGGDREAGLSLPDSKAVPGISAGGTAEGGSMRLLFRQRLFSWFDSYDIYDEAGNTVYTVEGKLAWGHCLHILNAAGDHIGTVREQVLTFLPKFELYVQDQYVGCIQKEFTFFTPKFDIDCNGWRVEGDFLEWDYRVTEACGAQVASIHKELLHWTDTYVIDVADPGSALCVLMLVLAIDAEKCSRN